VINVNWNDAVTYDKWLSKETGKHYRLPTEAEWEYACRSGGKQEEYCGGNDVNRVAWYSENSDHKTHPVGKKAANGLGLYDMSGNVREWVGDWYDKGYYGKSLRNNPKGPSKGSYRVVRGGCWGSGARGCRSAFRYRGYPNSRDADQGFRLARTNH
jgi:formylglycine-generating enzyme required for sulfatase activity